MMFVWKSLIYSFNSCDSCSFKKSFICFGCFILYSYTAMKDLLLSPHFKLSEFERSASSTSISTQCQQESKEHLLDNNRTIALNASSTSTSDVNGFPPWLLSDAHRDARSYRTSLSLVKNNALNSRQGHTTYTAPASRIPHAPPTSQQQQSVTSGTS